MTRCCDCKTKGGTMCPPSDAHLLVLGTGEDGRIYGRITGEGVPHFSRTWWYRDGRHNLFTDLDLSAEDAAAFVEANK